MSERIAPWVPEFVSESVASIFRQRRIPQAGAHDNVGDRMKFYIDSMENEASIRSPAETAWVLELDGNNNARAFMVGIGVEIRVPMLDLFRRLHHGEQWIFMHSHAGDSFSIDDKRSTIELATTGYLLNCPLLDHWVYDIRSGRWFSASKMCPEILDVEKGIDGLIDDQVQRLR